MLRKILILLILTSGIVTNCFGEASQKRINRGVWVSVFSEKKVLYSKDSVLELIDLCKKGNINEVYLQLFQSGKAFYDSKFCDRSKYEEMVKAAGLDTIDFLIKQAQKNNIQIFAWVNLLSLGQNTNAHIIKKFGNEVLTRDQYLRTSGRKDSNESDKYYLREDQLFLEPGDVRVGRYLLAIVEEIIKRYPLLNGIHLDYVRYPITVPFIPGSKFNKFGLSYGYSKKNIERFKEWTGIDPFSGLSSDEKSLKWDNWRRDQITTLVKRISRYVKEASLRYRVSCAVVPYSERAYASLFQDWPLWLKEGIVDYVVLMNYSRDNQLTKEVISASLAFKEKGKVFVGLGLFLLKDNLGALKEQYKIIKTLNPDGIVFFSYDDINDEILGYLQ